MSRLSLFLGALALLTFGDAPRDVQLDKITLPPGFHIAVYAENVPNARSLRLTPRGTLFVGTRRAGKVYAVVDRDADARADTVYTLAEGLNMPNGVAFRDGALYVAEVNRILRFDGIEDRLDDPPAPVVVYDGLPSDRQHGWKYIDFGPDGKLYVPVGAPCNVCDPDAPYASILRMNPDGSGVEVFARGIRNTVGFTWHPVTGELWFTDNGRDNIGGGDPFVTDNLPPCELNRAPAPGLHFGFPYVHAGLILDPEFGAGHHRADYTPPAQRLGPHVAPLGVEFYTGTQFPAGYRNQLFIAEHGSWNRTVKNGYRIMLVTVQDDTTAVSYAPFAEGWRQGNENWGRPVDLELMPDGAMLVSDDQNGVVYRISYGGG